jgi:hypothetical protein
MTIFHLTIRNVNRADGRSAVGAAAYCSRSRLYEGRGGREYDFRAAEGLMHSGLLLPKGTPDAWQDRSVFWNAVEGAEGDNYTAVAWEVEAVVPSELSFAEGLSAAREFVAETFSAWGVPADLSLHQAHGADGLPRMFVHILVPLRRFDSDELSERRRPWAGGVVLKKWRACWARLVNLRLIYAGVDSLIGTKVGETRGRCLELDVAVDGAAGDELAWRNGERILAEPGLVLDRAVQGGQGFTLIALDTLVRRLTWGEKQYSEALYRVRSLPGIVKLGRADNGEELFSVRGAAGEARQPDLVNESDRPSPLEATQGTLSEAREAYGALRAAVGEWESQGLRVRGAGLTYEQAKRFERATRIQTVGVHGLLGRWKKKTDLLKPADVLVVNDAAELSDAQKEWMLKAVRRERAKMVLVSGAEFVLIDGAETGLDARQTAAMAWSGA